MFENLFVRMSYSLRLSDLHLYLFDDDLMMVNIVIRDGVEKCFFLLNIS